MEGRCIGSPPRLVQRQCVIIDNAYWVGSQINWNRDQAHKLLGMHFDGVTHVIAVPVYYNAKQEQTVIRNHGSVVHPKGKVTRSILFTHQGQTPQRMMLNISSTHLALANIGNLDEPQLESHA